MPTFELEINGKVVEIDAPDEKSAVEAAKSSFADAAFGALDTFNAGTTFGLNDEIQGGLRAIGAMVPGGESPAEAYTKERDRVRASKSAFREENPMAAPALEMVGGGATGVMGASKAAAIPVIKNLGHTGRQVLGGAAGGAATGFGESEAISSGQLVGDTLAGAGIGGVAGPVLGKAGDMAGWAAGKLGTGFAKLFQSADKQSQEILQDVLRDTGMDISTLTQRMQELGPDAVLADVSEATAFKLRSLADTDLGLGQRARDVLDPRQAGAGGRLIDEAQATMGVPAERFTTSLEALDDVRREQARQMYGPIYDQPMPVDDEFLELLQRPSIAAGYKKAIRSARDAGEPMTTQLMPDGTLQGAPTLAEIDRIKRGIDDVIRDNTDPITGKMNSDARTASRAKKALLDYVDQADPQVADAYRQARSTYAGFSAREEAMRMGRNILKEDAERLETAVGKMGEDEREAFKIGAFNAVRDEIEGKIDTGDVSRSRAFFTEKLRRRLRHAFDSEDEFEAFLGAVERERTFAQTRGTVEGNSITARALAQQGQQADQESLINPEASLWGTTATAAKQAWNNSRAPNMAVTEKLGDALLQGGPPPVGPAAAAPNAPWRAGAAAYGGGMSLYDPEMMPWGADDFEIEARY
jgi:hypothetical protein